MTEGVTYYAYAVTFTGVSTDTFTERIDKHPRLVANWYRPPLPQTVFIVSIWPAKYLGERLRRLMPIQNLLILDAKTDRSGWLPSSAWDFLREPRPSDDED